MAKRASSRKTYLLVGLVSLVVMVCSLVILFLLPFEGLVLLTPLVFAALAGYVAFVSLLAALSHNPKKMLEDSITLGLIDVLFGMK